MPSGDRKTNRFDVGVAGMYMLGGVLVTLINLVGPGIVMAPLVDDCGTVMIAPGGDGQSVLSEG